MSISSGPLFASTANLALMLDATNPQSNVGNRSIINWNNWTVGTGGVTGYGQNGDGNSRVVDTNPWGNNAIVWQSLDNDVSSDADGGWNTSIFDIDNTKTYRFSTWVKRKVLGNGSFYLGTTGLNSAGSNVGVLNRSGGAVNTNPYFTSFGWNLSTDVWYLVVGHVWPAGSGTGAIHQDTGIYTVDGRVSTIADFVWQDTNAKSYHRSYLYYSTDPATRQQWYQPRVDLCDGTEPSIQELLQNAGNIWYDISGNNNNCKFLDLPNTDTGFYTFNGTSNYGTIINNSSLNFASSQTLQIVMRHTYTVGRKNPWDQAYGGYGTWTHEQGEYITQFYGNAGTNNNPYVGIGSATTPRSVWSVLCAVRSTTEFKWYLNGVLSNTSANPYGTLATTAANITIGNGYAGFWQGDMAMVTAYTRALTDDEVAQNFNAIRGRYGA